jgi:hypothetical protein
MVDNATAAPMPGVRFVAAWPLQWDVLGAPAEKLAQKEVVTDGRGAATFCDLPVGDSREVDVFHVQGDDARVPVLSVRLRPDGIRRHLIQGQLRRP